MSSHRRARFTLIAAAALVALPGGAAAQQASQQEAELRRRIQELTPTYLAAEEAADRAEAAAAAAARAALEPQEIVTVGPLRIATPRGQVAEVQRLWSSEWEFWSPLLGSSGQALRRMTFTHNAAPKPYLFSVDGAVKSVDFRRPVSEARLREAISGAIGSAAGLALPEALTRWSGSTALGARMNPARVYELFARTPTTLAQGCFGGSIQSCWTAFGQMDPSADPVTTWYTVPEQRALVAKVQGTSTRLSRECLDGVDATCHEFLEQRVQNDAMMPYPQTVRANLLWFALQRGGAGAMDRLVASVSADAGRPAVTNIRQHLGSASGMDPDVLMEQWRQGVLAGRPGAPTPEKRSRASTTLWITLFAALATRSKRWRLG